jgi:integrase
MSKSKQRGSLVFDKTFRGRIGRVRIRTGSHSPEFLSNLKEATQWLYDSGYWDHLEQLKNRTVTPQYIVTVWKTGNPLDVTEDPELLARNAWSAFGKWIDETYHADTTKDAFQKRLRTWRQHYSNDLTVSDLPERLRREKKRHQRNGTQPGFFLHRYALMQFAKAVTTKGKKSHLYNQFREVSDFSDNAKRRPHKNRPFTVMELDKLLHLHDVPERYREWIWFACLTGMNPKEMHEDGWKVLQHPHPHIEVWGRKRSGRFQRVVPLIMEPPTSRMPGREMMATWMRKLERSPYDLRRTFAIWCSRAGLDRRHISSYLGHRDGVNMLDLYLRDDVLNRWIPEDAKALGEYVKFARYDLSGFDDAPFIPYKGSSSMGLTRQANRMDDIKDELNKILARWHEVEFLQKRYRVDHLVEEK